MAASGTSLATFSPVVGILTQDVTPEINPPLSVFSDEAVPSGTTLTGEMENYLPRIPDSPMVKGTLLGGRRSVIKFPLCLRVGTEFG